MDGIMEVQAMDVAHHLRVIGIVSANHKVPSNKKRARDVNALAMKAQRHVAQVTEVYETWMIRLGMQRLFSRMFGDRISPLFLMCKNFSVRPHGWLM